MNPYALIAAGVALLIALAGSFAAGIRVESDHRDAQQLTLEKTWEQQYKSKAVAQNQTSNKLEGDKVVIKTRTQTIEKVVTQIVNRPVYLNACFDPDGLRCANAALTGQSSDSCKPDAAMPAADPAGDGNGKGDPGKDSGGGRPVP